MMLRATCEIPELQLPQPFWGSPQGWGAAVQRVPVVQHGQGVFVLEELGAPHDPQPLQRDLSHSIVGN